MCEYLKRERKEKKNLRCQRDTRAEQKVFEWTKIEFFELAILNFVAKVVGKRDENMTPHI